MASMETGIQKRIFPNISQVIEQRHVSPWIDYGCRREVYFWIPYESVDTIPGIGVGMSCRGRTARGVWVNLRLDESRPEC